MRPGACAGANPVAGNFIFCAGGEPDIPRSRGLSPSRPAPLWAASLDVALVVRPTGTRCLVARGAGDRFRAGVDFPELVSDPL